MNTNTVSLHWEVTEYFGNSITPKSITRLSDNVVFSVGDFVTNGTQMRGHIEKFSMNFKDNDITIYTDWSGIGMNLGSVEHIQLLPSEHQIGHKVVFTLNPDKLCIIKAVHFFSNKTKYDIEVFLGKLSEDPTRLYNVEEKLLVKRKIN